MKLNNIFKKGLALGALVLGISLFSSEESTAEVPATNDKNKQLKTEFAATTPKPLTDTKKGGAFRFGIGGFDALQKDSPAIDVRMECKWNKPLFEKVQPWVGIQTTSLMSSYAAAGITRDFKLANNLYLSPSFGAGLYYKGMGKDLGHPVEFRSEIGLGYEFNDKSRLQISFGHMSNGILGKKNPGAETFSFSYQIPIRPRP